ncbi:hypothetical protein GCM10007094_17940 [Pseudovibrio japonicus]|uniref:DUF819 family protein n=1 Tax=Pseudovibrio japonicus TaxID=366534 RepID=A0ABQ3EEK8_9HYPH|nr:hypothetical protein GCM10007094_17940 [Pseudovibrio japonicus]
MDRVGVVVLAFGLGFLIAIFGGYFEVIDFEALRPMQTSISEVSVALALPMIVFSTSLRKALKDAKGALFAMFLAMGSVALISFLASFVFADQVAQIWQVSGMAVGAYTGGGVNLGAVKTAIGGDESIFLTMITYDIVFSALFMMVVLAFGQKAAGLVLRTYVFKEAGEVEAKSEMDHLANESAHGYSVLTERESIVGSLIVFLSAAVCVGASVALASLAPESMSSVVTIILITTFGILGSFLPFLHNTRSSFHLGMYLILIFCLTSATMLDTAIFTNMDWWLGAYFISILAGSMMLLAALCRLFDVDRDTYLIASGASIMSVPFIPVIAGALKNREILIPGIAIAIIGYAVGNYLGILVATLTQTYVGG